MIKKRYFSKLSFSLAIAVCGGLAFGISNPSTAATLTLQENQPGLCRVDGDPAESKNAGFTGDGYANVANQVGTKIIWSVEAASTGSYQIQLRFANGGSGSRPGELSINDGSNGTYNVALSSTGAWTTWQTETVTVELIQGQNTIELIATGSDGLANVDYLNITGDNGLTPGSCGDSSADDDPYVTGCGNETSGLDASKVYYVTPTGSSSASGNNFSSAMDFQTALAAVGPGEMLLLKPGTYMVPYSEGAKNTINLTKSGTSSALIKVVAANCGRAVFDFSFPELAWVQDSYGFYVTGNYWYFKGIEITRAGYQGAYVTGQHNTFENCAFYENRNTGLEINKGGAYTTVINSDAYLNYDPKKFGSMADGFGPKQTQGPGNHFVGCRAWGNSDDGFDAYDSPEQVIIEKSWAFRNGVDIWNYGDFAGNGNGFKLGGNQVVARNRITNSVAFGNVVKGFDQNNNAGGVTVLNNIAYANGTNYGFGNPVSSGETHLFRNNVSLSGTVSIANANASFNSWDSGPSASSSDFLSLDLSLATVARNPDGTLPYNGLFRLAPGSDLIDAGTTVGLPFEGAAPDLGAFETGQ